MPRGQQSASSVNRVISFGRGKPLSVIQRAAQNRNNPQAVRQALGKPHLSDASAKAQGRLAQQYLDMLRNPTSSQIQHAAKKGITLNPNDFRGNAVQLGNRPPQRTVTPPGVPAVPKRAQRVHPPHGAWKEEWVIRPDCKKKDPVKQLKEIQRSADALVRRARLLRNRKIYRLVVEMYFDDGSVDWMSTPTTPTSDLQPIWDLNRWIFVWHDPGGRGMMIYRRRTRGPAGTVPQIKCLVGYLYMK